MVFSGDLVYCRMKKTALICLVLLGFIPAQAFASKKADKERARLENIGLQWLDGRFKDFDSLQKKIHGYAEVGYKDYKSSETLASHLEANGFTVERGVAGIPTAFVATFGSGHPVIGLMAEYDALPGMSQDTVSYKHPMIEGAPGHGCGHNILGTAAVAGAEAIAQYLADGHPGTVKLFGCPAEEGGAGKAYMVMRGCFEGTDLVFDWHPAMANFVELSSGLANVSARFTFTGKAAHASGNPWDGRSALDAVEAFDYMINMMREHVPQECRIHYVITQGGDSPNIVPQKAQVLYYFRHPKAEVLRDILGRAIKAAEGAALGTGTKMEYELIHGNYERLINAHLAGLIHKSLMRVGGLKLDEREKQFMKEVLLSSGVPAEQHEGIIGKFGAVVPEVLPATPGGVSSDAGNVSQVVPLAKLDVATGLQGLHTWQMAAVAGSTIGTKSLMTVAKTLYLTAVGLYNNPADVKAVRDEFESARGKDFKFEPLMGWREPPFDYRDR